MVPPSSTRPVARRAVSRLPRRHLGDISATPRLHLGQAFHVFKIYVANPNKGAAVHDLLLRNKERLQAFLAAFQNDRADEQFAEEKRFVMDEIARLEPR